MQGAIRAYCDPAQTESIEDDIHDQMIYKLRPLLTARSRVFRPQVRAVRLFQYLRNVRGKESVGLRGDDHTSDRGGGQRSEDTRDKR